MSLTFYRLRRPSLQRLPAPYGGGWALVVSRAACGTPADGHYHMVVCYVVLTLRGLRRRWLR